MRTNRHSPELIDRAAGALSALLAQVSGVRLEEIRRESAGRGAALLARIDVFGHSHFLACAVDPAGELEPLRALLNDYCGAFPAPADATRLVIAPRLSPDAQALCKEHRAGFLDLEGNARLSVGELFICMRAIPCRNADASVVSTGPQVRVPAHSGDRSRVWELPHQPAGAPLPA
ncbi:MAG: hypothetical protein ACLQG3_07385 [Terracidiphilus sp.]